MAFSAVIYRISCSEVKQIILTVLLHKPLRLLSFYHRNYISELR